MPGSPARVQDDGAPYIGKIQASPETNRQKPLKMGIPDHLLTGMILQADTECSETNESHLKMDGWKLEDDRFLLGRFGLFSRAFAVSFREGNWALLSDEQLRVERQQFLLNQNSIEVS